MKQKKLEVSCARRRNLKQTRVCNEASPKDTEQSEGAPPKDPEQNGSSSKTHYIVVPGVSVERGTEGEEGPDNTESDELESNDSKVIDNGNNSTEDCEQISAVICDSDLPDNLGRVVLDSEDNKQEKNSEDSQETLAENQWGKSENSQDKILEIHSVTEDIYTDVPDKVESSEGHGQKREVCEDKSPGLIKTPGSDKDKASEMKSTKTDLRPIEEESEEKGDDRRSNSSASRKSAKRDRSLRRGSSGAALSSPRHSSSRHSFSCVEGKKSLLKESNSPRRSQSAIERPKTRGSFSDPFKFTKRELEWYLPRKSFFDCHDKALKEAGIETAVTTSKREQMKQRVAEKIQREKDLREKRKELEKPKAEETKTEAASAAVEESQVDIGDSKSERDADTKSEMDKSDAEDDVVIAKLQEAQTLMSRPTQTRKSSKHKKKAHDYDEDEVRVDYQPLLQYLRYVQDHPEEFHAHRKHQIQQEHVGTRASPWIVRLAEINERRNVSTAQCLVSKSVVLEAARDIRPRTTDPGQWTMSQKERALLGNMNPGKVNAFTAVKQDLPTHDSQNQDEGKSDFEKEKAKLEKWLKTVSTAGLIKAKELALRDLGEEDIYQSRWWTSLQTCSYLRQKGINPT